MIPEHFAYSGAFTVALLSSGESVPFAAPSGFTGHVYIRGNRGDEQAVFLIGSNGDANFVDDGFKFRLGNNAKLPNVDIQYISPLSWKLVYASSGGDFGPTHPRWVRIALVGIAFGSLPSLIGTSGHELSD